MWAYRIALFFAIFGVITGAFEATMLHTETEWFPGADASHVQMEYYAISNDELEVLNDANDLTMTERIMREYQTAGMFLNGMYRIFFIKDVVEGIFMVPNPDNPSENLFSIFASVIQVGIWYTYWIAGIQIWRRMGFKGAY